MAPAPALGWAAPGMQVFLFSLQLALGIALPWWVVRRDMRRLPDHQLARTWNDASFWSAIVAFGPLCIPVHFIKARRSLWGVALGVLWLAAVWLAIVLLATGIEWLGQAVGAAGGG